MSKDTPKLAIYDFTNSGLETVKLNQGAATARAINRYTHPKYIQSVISSIKRFIFCIHQYFKVLFVKDSF